MVSIRELRRLLLDDRRFLQHRLHLRKHRRLQPPHRHLLRHFLPKLVLLPRHPTINNDPELAPKYVCPPYFLLPLEAKPSNGPQHALPPPPQLQLQPPPTPHHHPPIPPLPPKKAHPGSPSSSSARSSYSASLASASGSSKSSNPEDVGTRLKLRLRPL